MRVSFMAVRRWWFRWWVVWWWVILVRWWFRLFRWWVVWCWVRWWFRWWDLLWRPRTADPQSPSGPRPGSTPRRMRAGPGRTPSPFWDSPQRRSCACPCWSRARWIDAGGGCGRWARPTASGSPPPCGAPCRDAAESHTRNAAAFPPLQKQIIQYVSVRSIHFSSTQQTGQEKTTLMTRTFQQHMIEAFVWYWHSFQKMSYGSFSPSESICDVLYISMSKTFAIHH